MAVAVSAGADAAEYEGAANAVLADLEREGALEPDRAGGTGDVALVVAGEGGDAAVPVLQLVVAEAEALAPPAGLEQSEQAIDAAGAVAPAPSVTTNP